MTNELIRLQKSISSAASGQIQQQETALEAAQQARNDESFQLLLGRLDKLRQIARNKGTRRKLREKVQTSFAF